MCLIDVFFDMLLDICSTFFDNFEVLGRSWDHFLHQEGLGHHPDAKLHHPVSRLFGFGPPKGGPWDSSWHHFCNIFAIIFWHTFRRRVLEASGHQFERILDQFVDRFLIFSVKRGASSGDAKIIVLHWFLQCLVAIDLLTNKLNKSKICRQNGRCFAGGLSAPLVHRFWLDVDPILKRFGT